MAQNIEVLADRDALIARALALVRDKMLAAIRQRGWCSIALAGGGTPQPLYQALAQESLPWHQIHAFWGDERYVPADSPDSNQRMAREAWLDRVGVPPGNIHPMPTEANDPEADARAYEATLQECFQPAPGEGPRFDFVLLGMGDDGHTASLFPQSEAVQVRDHWVTVGRKDGNPRLTLTVPVLNQARCVVFLVAGETKTEALQHVFAPDGDEMAYPARAIQPSGELWWLLDGAAGAALEAERR